jgi:hypothetical protein
MANPLQTPNTTWPLIHPDLITTVSTTITTTVIMEIKTLQGLTSLLFSRDYSLQTTVFVGIRIT